MKFILYVPLLASLAINGCSYEEEPLLPIVPEITRSLEATLEAKAEPNKYEVQLRWKVVAGGPSWVVHRQDHESGPRLLSTLEADSAEYVDTQVIAGKEYRYLLGALSDGNYSTVAQTTVKVPTDMEIGDRQVITDITGINRLFLSSHARLVTQGKDVLIWVDEIISDNAVIESFPQGTEAPSGETGRNGGFITVRAKRGRGSLLLHARGEGGGRGAPGIKGANGYHGKAGKYAVSTHEKVDVVCNCGKHAKELRERIKNFDPVAYFQFRSERMRHRCISQPTDGLPGGPGTAGTHGSHGGMGGNSAKIYVEIDDASQIEVSVFSLPGPGGIGGKAGTGGKGGMGGDPGDRKLDFYFNCRDPARGQPGLAGVDGKLGLAGQNGAEEPVCLRLGEQNSPDCKNFKN